MTETELVDRCRSGYPEAIRELVQRFQPEVYSLCWRMLRHQQDAEDVTQEVMFRVFKSLHRWDRERPLRPWILTIATNRCRTWLSQRPRRPDLIEHLSDLASNTPEPNSRELADAIQEGLTELRPDYREVFVLFHEQGLPYETIGEVTGRPVGTIKTWLHRARLQLLNYLVKHGHLPHEEAHPAEGGQS